MAAGGKVDPAEEMLELHGLTMRGIAALIANSPGYFSRTTSRSALLSSGEPCPDLNMIMIGPDADAPRFLEESVSQVRRQGLQAVAMLTPDIAPALEPTCRRLGLTALGNMPVMTFDVSGPSGAGAACEFVRVADALTSALAGDVQSAAFELPRECVARSLDTVHLTAGGPETFIALSQGKPVAAMTVIRFGEQAGIWTMATLPEHQRKGIGRALMTCVLEQYRQAGVSRFFLSASEAGRALYLKMGFSTVGEYSVWLVSTEHTGSRGPSA